MKITVKRIKQIIKEELIREQRSEMVELSSSPPPSRREVADAWPDNVYHNGKKVFDTFYQTAGQKGVNDGMDWISRDGYEGQEVYLGYDPDGDDFVMGFDAFYDGLDDYNQTDNFDSEMEGVIIRLDDLGTARETIATVPGGMYPRGLKAVETAMPRIIHVRLD